MTVYHCNSLAVQALGNIKMLKMGDLEEYLGKTNGGCSEPSILAMLVQLVAEQHEWNSHQIDFLPGIHYNKSWTLQPGIYNPLKYSGTLLIWSLMGHKNLGILTGWPLNKKMTELLFWPEKKWS